jgi:nicotinate-nucleotide--dimethylbenzimidazole phosphoribosyltransferase
VGGFDLAGMAGVFIGGASAGVPVVIDGFISAVAALLASRICPSCIPYIMASHVSKEPAAKLVLRELGKKPFLTCDMCLGEGTGAVMIFPLLDMALKVYNSMSTFEEDHIEAYQHLV